MSRFWRKDTHKKNYCYALEVYNKTTIFILVYITEDVVKYVEHKLAGILGPVSMDLEALQRWLLKLW